MFNRNDFYPELNMTNAARNELANRPRYDIEGDRRYGNTLSDDMFALKNKNYQGHTPESYEYFNDPEPQVQTQMSPAGGWGEVMGIPQLKKDPVEQYIAANPYLKYGTNEHEARLFGRKKNVGTEALPWETYRDDWTLEDDILEFPDSYTQEQVAWAEQQRADREARNRVASLGTDDLRAEKLGTYQDPTEWVSRRDSDVDSTLGTLVNYGALSPATIEQLAKMGVNRPVESDPNSDDAALYLNFLLDAYRRRNEQTNY